MLVSSCGSTVELTSGAGTGGAFSMGSVAGAGGQSAASTASSTGGLQPFADCDSSVRQVFSGQLCGYQTFNVATTVSEADAGSGANCNIALGHSPVDPNLVTVTVDCTLYHWNEGNHLDAGDVDAFAIDYGPTPAHLILLGSGCRTLQLPGLHHVDVAEGCACPC